MPDLVQFHSGQVRNFHLLVMDVNATLYLIFDTYYDFTCLCAKQLIRINTVFSIINTWFHTVLKEFIHVCCLSTVRAYI